MEWTIEKESELEGVAAFVVEKVLSKKSDKAKVIGLYGNLGAGKTAFTKILVRTLGGSDNVVSPTFILERRYELNNELGFKQLSHIDAYRFDDEKEGEVLKIEKNLHNNAFIYVIEWPENMGSRMPEHTKVFFEHLGGDKRKITLSTENEK